jgi:hypothetical protein
MKMHVSKIHEVRKLWTMAKYNFRINIEVYSCTSNFCLQYLLFFFYFK